MVARLSGVDALSLHTQASTQADTVTLIIVEASDQLSHERLHQLVATTLPQLARFRSQLVGKPLGVGQPVWAEIDDYDPTSQIQCAAVPAPGGRRELADLIAQLSAHRQDGRQPLWEAWSIDGLADGQWALAVKMSPILSERGGGAAAIWQRLLTSGPRDATPDNVPNEPSLGSAPSFGELVTDAATEIVENQITVMWSIAEAVTGALRSVRRRLRGTDEPEPLPSAVSSMSGPVPHNMFSAPPTQRRSVAFAAIPLADAEMVSNAFGGSIANVLLAACTLSLRNWLHHYDSAPRDALVMRVPVSLPTDDLAVSGNASTVGKIRLPVQLDDPVQILTNLHTATEMLTIDRSRNHEREDSTVDFATITSLVPPPIMRAGMLLYTALGLDRWRAPIHGSVSYMPGKPVPAYCAGAKVVGMHATAPLSGGRGLTITVTCHDDVIDVCVCACPDNVPGVDDIATGIAESVDILVAAAQESPRGYGRSVVSEMTSHVEKRSPVKRF